MRIEIKLSQLENSLYKNNKPIDMDEIVKFSEETEIDHNDKIFTNYNEKSDDKQKTKEEEKCQICFDNLTIINTCKCTFCFDCINRHLKKHRTCPSCLKFCNSLNLKPTVHRKHDFKKFLKLNGKNTSSWKTNTKKLFKEYGISTMGDTKTLKWRYNELKCQLENACYNDKMISMVDLALNIQRKEDLSTEINKNRKIDKAAIISTLRDLKKKLLVKIQIDK